MSKHSKNKLYTSSDGSSVPHQCLQPSIVTHKSPNKIPDQWFSRISCFRSLMDKLNGRVNSYTLITGQKAMVGTFPKRFQTCKLWTKSNNLCKCFVRTFCLRCVFLVGNPSNKFGPSEAVLLLRYFDRKLWNPIFYGACTHQHISGIQGCFFVENRCDGSENRHHGTLRLKCKTYKAIQMPRDPGSPKLRMEPGT